MKTELNTQNQYKNLVANIEKSLKNVKNIYVIGSTGVGKSFLIEELKKRPTFQNYNVISTLECFDKEKNNFVDQYQFIELQKGEDLKKCFNKILNPIQSAIVLLSSKSSKKDDIEKQIINISEEQFILNTTKNNTIEIFLLTNQIFIGFICLTNITKNIKDKTLDIKNTTDAKTKISDIKVIGNPDIWQLITKASSEKEGWMKSTKAMDVGNGCLVQMTTQQKNLDGSYSISETSTFIPNVDIKTDENGNKYLMDKTKLIKPSRNP